MSTYFFNDLLGTIVERGRSIIERNRDHAATDDDLADLAETLVGGRGEASGVAVAATLLDGYRALDRVGRSAFFKVLAERFGAPVEPLEAAAKAFLERPDDRHALFLHDASESRRQELIRRLNRAPGGTAALVAMRGDLLRELKEHPELAAVDHDFRHLLASWFNRGFLVVRRIDWSTPAVVLEKIIRYEAVHRINGWEDLRRRIDPADRRLYAFFHPALVDDPLIFVEIALTLDIPSAIAPILAEERQPLDPKKATTAVFYSISNCQDGLRGISFGHFLIKQVVEELVRDFPGLDTFVTLSPVPGFRDWLDEERQDEHSTILTAADRKVLDRLDDPAWTTDEAAVAAARPVLQALGATYFHQSLTRHGTPTDPVARFHLGNGARLERVNALADGSAKALAASHGLMVNYLYDPKQIERNHEAYANEGKIAVSTAVRRLVRKSPQREPPQSEATVANHA